MYYKNYIVPEDERASSSELVSLTFSIPLIIVMMIGIFNLYNLTVTRFRMESAATMVANESAYVIKNELEHKKDIPTNMVLLNNVCEKEKGSDSLKKANKVLATKIKDNNYYSIPGYESTGISEYSIYMSDHYNDSENDIQTETLKPENYRYHVSSGLNEEKNSKYYGKSGSIDFKAQPEIRKVRVTGAVRLFGIFPDHERTEKEPYEIKDNLLILKSKWHYVTPDVAGAKDWN